MPRLITKIVEVEDCSSCPYLKVEYRSCGECSTAHFWGNECGAIEDISSLPDDLGERYIHPNCPLRKGDVVVMLKLDSPKKLPSDRTSIRKKGAKQ
jgi:cell shape-determining protein MreC